jgi:hypothetical protein
VLWATARAGALLADSFPPPSPANGGRRCRSPTGSAAKARAPEPTNITVPGDAGPALVFPLVTAIGPEEYLLTAKREQNLDEVAILRAAFALTPCEAEVLVWTARGKSNRDVGDPGA